MRWDWYAPAASLDLSLAIHAGYVWIDVPTGHRVSPHQNRMTPDALLDHLKQQIAEDGTGRPLHRRLEHALEQAIAGSLLGRGAVLPSERAMSDALSVSRVTVRKALEGLVGSGLLNRRRGSRTEVGPRVEKSLARLTSFSEDMLSRGLEPGGIWLSKQVTRPGPSEMMALGLPNSEQILRLKRIRTADGMPIAIETAAVPTRFLPSPERIADSLYRALAEAGFMPDRAVQRLHSAPATAEDVRLLKCPPSTALLVMERRCFLADSQIVEFTETRYRGDVYDFVVELAR